MINVSLQLTKKHLAIIGNKTDVIGQTVISFTYKILFDGWYDWLERDVLVDRETDQSKCYHVQTCYNHCSVIDRALQITEYKVQGVVSGAQAAQCNVYNGI